MKILFISPGDQPDYLCDCIYHGLKTLIGKDLESTADMWYMYNTLLYDDSKYLYGKGFTLYGLLDSELKNTPKPRRVIANIETHYYDYVIYGSIIKDQTLLNLVRQYYSKREIVFIDGEDVRYVNKKLLNKGIYFKRELRKIKHNIFPISFSIPKEKIINTVPAKTGDWAISYPGNLGTYIFNNEVSYYSDYQRSKFAVTFKKEGWDCLRHYEILANGCMPYFKNIENCPAGTMVNFPKEIINEISLKLDKNKILSNDEYRNYSEKLLKLTKENLTTEAVVTSILKKISAKNKIGGAARTKKSNEKNMLLGDTKIDKILEFAGPKNISDPALIYSGVSSIQNIRFLTGLYSRIYATDTFESAVAALKTVLNGEDSKVKFVKDIFLTEVPADTIILDMTLPYQENTTEYFIKIKGLMKPGAKLILIVPNFKNIGTVTAFFKDDFRFGKIKLAKTPPVNFYSKETIGRLLMSFGIKISRMSAFGFDNSHFIKRLLNRITFLRYWNSKMLIVEAFLNE